ncbi:hypothetical protein LNO81_08095 [Klebsiella variicola subsp. variicola]|nr:hypothetical protein [Klebsiella variicola subsp. variicola]
MLMGALLAGSDLGASPSSGKNFFPSSNTPIFFVDLWLPYGTDINATEQMTRDIERSIASQPGVATTVSTIGRAVCDLFSPTAGSASTATTRRLWCGWTTSAVSPPVTRHVEAWIAETTRR